MPKRQSHKINGHSSTVIEFPAKNIHKEFSASAKFESLKIIHSEWLADLSPSEYKLVCFIWQRTIYWGKKREAISHRHFLEGITNRKTGEIVQKPTGLSKQSVISAINSLEEKGVLSRTQRGQNAFTYHLNLGWMPKMLKEPKNKKGGSGTLKTPKGGVQKLDPGGSKILTPKYDNIKYAHKEEESESELSHPGQGRENSKRGTDDTNEYSDNPAAGLEESIAAAKKVSAAAREKKMARAAKRENVADLEKMWVSKMHAVHPDCPMAAWTVKQCGQVKNFRDQYKKETGGPVWPFFDFCIANWHRIGKLRFAWMKGLMFPEYPSVDFLMGFKKHFILMMGDERFYERQIGMTQKERDIAKLIKQGYTMEQAEKVYLDDLEQSKIVQRQSKRADAAEKDVRGVQQTNRQLEAEIKRLKLQQGRELIAKQKEENAKPKVNPGSIVKKKVKRDKDGFVIPEDDYQDRF